MGIFMPNLGFSQEFVTHSISCKLYTNLQAVLCCAIHGCHHYCYIRLEPKAFTQTVKALMFELIRVSSHPLTGFGKKQH